jgi:type IV pilus assembly protein PilB
MPPLKSFGERIADALIEDGLLNAQQVGELLEQQKKEGTRLLKLILAKGLVSESDMVVSMGRVLNVPPINVARIGVSPETAELISREIATNHKVLPVSRLDSKLFVAMADPLNVLALDDIRRITKLEVVPLIASEKAILDKLSNLDSGQDRMRQIVEDAQRAAEDDAEAENLQVARETMEEVNLDQLAVASEEGPVIKLANLIIVQAIKDRASDIHLEPFEKTVRLRYRIDGV